MSDKLDMILTELQTLKTNQQRHNDLIHQLIQIVGTTNAKVETLDTKVQALDTKVQALDTKVQALDDKVQALDTKVQALDDKVSVLVEDNAVIKQAVHKTVDGIKRIEENQDSIYEMLGDHDVQIRTLKRIAKNRKRIDPETANYEHTLERLRRSIGQETE